MPWSRFLLPLLLVAAGLTACAEGPPRPRVTPVPAIPPAAVLAAVRAAPAVRVVPSDLIPAAPARDIGFDSDRCEAGPAADRIEPCVFGDRASGVRVVLVGGSHAGTWLPAMIPIAEQRHWRLEFFGKPGCPGTAVCDRFGGFVLGRVRARRPALTVVAGLSDRTLRRLPGPVVVLGEIPVPATDPPDCVARNGRNLAACFTSRAAATAGSADAAGERAARAAGGVYVPVLPWLCGAVCTPVIGNVAVYRNRFQLTATYTRMLRGVLEDALVSAGRPGSRP